MRVSLKFHKLASLNWDKAPSLHYPARGQATRDLRYAVKKVLMQIIIGRHTLKHRGVPVKFITLTNVCILVRVQPDYLAKIISCHTSKSQFS